MSYLLDSITNSNIMLFLIIVLLIFIAMTIVYIIHLQIEANKIKEKRQDVPVFKEEVKPPVNQESLELQSITRELETIPKERIVNMTPYETEQEEKAIISYDELIQKNYPGAISYSDTSSDDDILVKKVDLEDTQRINIEKVKEEKEKVENLLNYEHEEQFLKELKELNNLIN